MWFRLYSDIEGYLCDFSEKLIKVIDSPVVRTKFVEEFRKNIDEEYKAVLLKSHRVYLRISDDYVFCEKIKLKIELFKDNVKEKLDNILNVLECTRKHFNFICQMLEVSIDFNELTDFYYGFSDMHDNLLPVSILSFGTEKIVVKNKTNQSDLVVFNLLYFLNKKLGTELYLPKIYSAQNYSWQEFIHSQGLKSNSIDKYLYNLGALIAGLYAINATDIHYENIFCDGELPVLVDTETIFNILDVNEKNKDTIFNTDILPFAFKGEDYLNEIFLSGIGSILRHSNQIDIINSLENLVVGFREAYTTIAENKGTFCKELFYDVDLDLLWLRTVLESTRVYAKLISNINHPLLILDDNKNKQQFSVLRDKSCKLLTYEVESLYKNKIPIFYHQMKNTNIYYMNKFINYFSMTALECFYQKVEKMGKEDYIYQEYLIKLSLSFLSLNLLIEKNIDVDAVNFSFNNYDFELEGVEQSILYLIDMASYYLDDSIEWLCLSNNNSKYYYFRRIGYDLYDGKLGILYALHDYEVDESELFQKLDFDIKKYYDNCDKLEYVGFFNGVGGYLFYLLENSSTETISLVIDLFVKVYRSYSFSSLDIYEGVCGIVVLGILIFKKTKSSLVLELCEKIMEKYFLKSNIESFGEEYGLLHGKAGVLFTLNLYFSVTGKVFLSEIQEYLKKDLIKSNSKTLNNSLCTGRLGIDFAMKKIKLPIEHAFADSFDDISICHGVSSLYMLRLIDRMQYLESIKQNHYKSGNFSGVVSFGLMTGLSGVLYALRKQNI